MASDVRAGWASPLLAASCCALFLAATCAQEGNPVVIHPPALEAAEVNPELGRRAYRHVDSLVQLGPRFTGSPGWREAVDYIAETLQKKGVLGCVLTACRKKDSETASKWAKNLKGPLLKEARKVCASNGVGPL